MRAPSTHAKSSAISATPTIAGRRRESRALARTTGGTYTQYTNAVAPHAAKSSVSSSSARRTLRFAATTIVGVTLSTRCSPAPLLPSGASALVSHADDERQLPPLSPASFAAPMRRNALRDENGDQLMLARRAAS